MLYLLDGDVRTVRWNGLPLHEASSAIVKEELNGDHFLVAKYPISDSGIYRELREDLLIKAPVPVLGPQLFRIKKPVEYDDHVELTAYHITDDIMQRSVEPMGVNQTGCAMALSQLVQRVKTPLGDFSLTSDIFDRHTFNTKETETLYSVLMDGKHSIVGTWEGELVRDNFALSVKKARGADRGVIITTHNNLESYQRTRNSQGVVTRVHAKSTFRPEGAEVDTVLQVTVDSPLINQYPYINEKEYENNEAKTVDELRKWAEAKFKHEKVDQVTDAIEIEAYELDGQTVHLGDTVTIKSSKHGVDLTKKAIAYEFDCLANGGKGAYLSLTFDDSPGAGGSGVSSGVSAAAEAILGAAKTAEDRAIDKAIANANAAFDAEFDKAKQAIENGIEEAKAAGEAFKAEISSEVEAVAREAQAVRQAVEAGLIEARAAGEALKAAVTAEVEAVAREGQAVKQAVEAGLAEAERAAQVLGSEVRNRVGQVEAKANQLADQARQSDQKADQALTRAGASEHLALTAKDTADRAIRQAGDNLRTAQERANQLQVDLDAAKRSITSQARDILTQAQAQADLSRKVQTVEETANGTRSTVTELTKTVNVATGNLASVTQRVVTAETTLTGVRDQYRQLSQTVSGQTGQIAGINQKTATLERGLDRVGEQFEALEASNEGIRQELASYVRTATENTSRLEQSIQTADGKAEGAKTLALQTAQGLALKAEKTEVDGVTSRVDSVQAALDGLRSTSATKAELKVVSDGITQLATKTEVNGVTGRLTTAEASIRTQADQIAQRLTSSQVESAITAKGYQTKAQVDANITGRGYITTAALAGYVPTTTFDNYKTETAQRIERGLTATRALIPTKGGVVNLVANSTINQSSAAYGFATRQVKLEAGKTYWFGARAKKTGGAAGKEARVWLIAPGWAESRVLSFAGTDYETKFLKFSPKNTAIFDIRSYWFPNGGDRSGTADIDWYLVVESDLEPTGWVPNPEDMVSAVDFNRVKETAELYERVIGRSEGDIQTNVARQVLTSQLYQTEVKNPLTQLGSKVTQLEGSYGIQLSNKEKILSELNLNTGGVRIAGKLIHLDGTVTASDAFFRSVMADKIEAGNIKAGAVTTVKLAANAVTADKLVVDRALIDKLVTNSLWADRLFAQTAFITKLKAVDIQAGQIRAGLITTAMLAANAVTADKLVVDRALIDKLVTNSLWADRLFAQTAFITKLKAVDIQAGQIRAGLINTSMLAANAVTADKLVVDQALFTKLMANEAYLKQLFAKQAFITQVQAVDLSATRIKSGILQAINGAMSINLDQANITFNQNATITFNSSSNAIIRKSADGVHTGFLHFGVSPKGGIYTSIGSTSASDGIDSQNSGGHFAGVRIYRTSASHNSHAASEDRIDLVADNIYLTHGETGKAGGILFRPVTIDSNQYVDFAALIQSVMALWRMWEHVKNTKYTWNDRFVAAMTSESTAYGKGSIIKTGNVPWT